MIQNYTRLIIFSAFLLSHTVSANAYWAEKLNIELVCEGKFRLDGKESGAADWYYVGEKPFSNFRYTIKNSRFIKPSGLEGIQIETTETLIFVETDPPVSLRGKKFIDMGDGKTAVAEQFISEFKIDRLTGALTYELLIIVSEGASGKVTYNGKCSKLDPQKKLF